MRRTIWIRDGYCAVAEGDRLVEYIPVSERERTGEILRGRVERLMSSLQCAFVDIGRKRSGFLPLYENSETFREAPVRSGEEVWVQIRKEEIGEKGAFLSRDLSIPGSALILMPMNRYIGVSSRIRDPEDRARLQAVGRELTGGACGLVMRSAALAETEDTLREEYERLTRRWTEAAERARLHPEERVILRGNTIEEELLNDYLPRGGAEIRRDSDLPPDLRRQLREAENRKIRLPHGGNLVIDPCEAMTVIDVNTASDARGRSRRETVLETNLEACRELAVQARLRNLSGILILDLIDMDDAEDRERVMRELEAAFAEDRVKTVIHGLTRLGLVEMTRRRGRAPVELTKPSP